MNKYYWTAIAAIILSAVIAVLYGFTVAGKSPPKNDSSKSLRNAMQQRIDASTPEMLSRSYKAILSSMTADQKQEFLEALSGLMKSSGSVSGDADASFRRQIDGKSASSIIAEAKEANRS